MKKTIILFVFLAGFMCFANAQTHKHHPFSTPDKKAHKSLKHSNILHGKGLVWQWDTITAYSDDTTLQERHSAACDINGNVVAVLVEDWLANTWMNNELDSCTYDANNNLTSYLCKNWQTDAWVNIFRYTFTYDANGNQLTEIYQEWQTNAWVNVGKDTYTYDTTGNMLSDLYTEWQTNAWVNVDRYTDDYDTTGIWLGYLHEEWQSSAWVNYSKYVCTSFDTSGNMLTGLYKHWQSNMWLDFGRDNNTYDASGNKLTDSIEIWQTGAWVNMAKFIYTYDANGNMLAEIYQEWITDWENYDRLSYTYDANGNSITGKYEIWDNGKWNSDVYWLSVYADKDYIYDLDNVHRYEARFKLYTGIADIQKNNTRLTVFPNPAHDVLIIETTKGSTLSIYNVSGQKLTEQQITEGKTQLDINSLPSGVYIVKVKTDKGITVKKFVKQ